jgi:hypothetical protein
VSGNPRFERFVLAELALRDRRARRRDGSAGYLARVVARAAIEDRLDGARPVGETLTALCLLPNPRLAT